MRSLPVLGLAVILAMLIILMGPCSESNRPAHAVGHVSLGANAHPGDPSSPIYGMLATNVSPRLMGLGQSLAGEDYAIHVCASGTYTDDGVILPVFENLEERYAAENREFTVEYWFKLAPDYNADGKELFDHHIPSQEGFWTAFQYTPNTQLWAGIDSQPDSNATAIHVHTGYGFIDGEWHHYALVREVNDPPSPDRLCLYLDGAGSCYSDDNPAKDPVSAEIRSPLNRDGGDGNNKPLYVIGARTNGGGEIEAAIDELRVSDLARYKGNFTPSIVPFSLDANTVMLFHFDEGAGNKTYGLSSTDGLTLEGILVESFGNYGLSLTPLDPDDPLDAAHLSEMWVNGRFGTVTPPSSLTIISPNGGEQWSTGSQQSISWTSAGSIIDVSLSYSADGFTAISHTIVASTPNTGVYTWTTPITPATIARVRVADAANPAIYDDSDADFSLIGATYYLYYLPVILKFGP